MRLEERARPQPYGLYRVTGKRDYRGHSFGEEFEARLDREAERRAITRGDIVLLREIVPELQPGSFTFPDGWLPSPHESNQRAPKGALSLRRE